MRHPDSNLVGLLFLAMVAVGALAAIIVCVTLGIKSYRFLPLRRSRTTFWIGMILTSVFALAALLVAGWSMRTLAVIASCGWDAYDGGLRVVNKHGLLSDGRYLGIFWHAATGAGTAMIMFSAIIPAVVWWGHYNPSRNPKLFLQLSGTVYLNDQPLPRALVTFYLVVGEKLRGYIAVDTDENGGYEFHNPPLKPLKITVAGAEVPPEYADPASTPLQFVGDRIGEVTYDISILQETGAA